MSSESNDPAQIETITPPDQLTAVRYALDHPGPTRLSDVEQARHEMAVLAARLHDEGKIRLTTRRISVAA